jgi:hypothetical protein
MNHEKGNSKTRVVQKYKMDEVDDIWSSLLSDESSDNDDEQFEGENLLYHNSYPDDGVEEKHVFDTAGEQLEGDGNLCAESLSDSALGNEQAPEETAQVSSEAYEFSAVLEFIGGMRQEVARARLFEPQENTILLIDEDTNDELIVFFEQLVCIQISGLPAGISDKQKEICTKEIIETVDGNIYHVLVPSKQDFNSLLYCFSTEEQGRLPVTIFPKSNIRKRCQDKLLIDILLEKRFISRSILQKALQEFEKIKSLTIEQIIAKKARIPLKEIEEALEKAKKNQMLGLQIGEILLISGLVNEDQILDALDYHEHIKNLEIGQFLIDKGVVNEIEVYISLAEKHRIPYIDLRKRKITNESLAILPESMIVNHEILPLVKKNDMLLVAMHVVDMTHLSETIAKTSGCKYVKYVMSSPTQIRKIINLLYDKRK